MPGPLSPRNRSSAIDLRHALEEAESWSRAVLVEGKREFIVVDPETAKHELEKHPLSVAWTSVNRQVEESLKCVPFPRRRGIPGLSARRSAP